MDTKYVLTIAVVVLAVVGLAALVAASLWLAGAFAPRGGAQGDDEDTDVPNVRWRTHYHGGHAWLFVLDESGRVAAVVHDPGCRCDSVSEEAQRALLAEHERMVRVWSAQDAAVDEAVIGGGR
jgi:hypothetical protein